MKTKLPPLIIAFMTIIGHVYAAPLQPVVLATRGEPMVSANGKSESLPIVLKQTVGAESKIVTGVDGQLALAIAPGQLLVIERNSSLEVKSVHSDSKGAELLLSEGTVRCSIDPELGHTSPVYKVLVAQETIQAEGTVWQTGKASDGKTTTIVLSSRVSVSIEGMPGLTINVPAGSVLTSTYVNGVWTGSKVVNLVNGRVTSYSPAGVVVGIATVTELGQARGDFISTLGQLTDLILGKESAGLSVLVSQINAVLAAAGLSPLTLPTGISGSTGRDSVVSPNAP